MNQMVALLEFLLTIALGTFGVWFFLSLIVSFAVDDSMSEAKLDTSTLEDVGFIFKPLEDSDELAERSVIAIRDRADITTIWYRDKRNGFRNHENCTTASHLARMIKERGLLVGFQNSNSVSLSDREENTDHPAKHYGRAAKGYSSFTLVIIALVISLFGWVLVNDSKSSHRMELEEAERNASIEMEDKTEEFNEKLAAAEGKNEKLIDAISTYCENVIDYKKKPNESEIELCVAAQP